MLSAKLSRIKRIGKRALRIALSAMLVLQMLWVPNSALAASSFYFRGYGSENINSSTLSYATNGATVSGRDVTISPTASEGEAIGLVNLDEADHDISKSVDLGGLEIDFSTVSNVTLEGVDGADNDVPTAKILFCSSADIGSVISSVTLTKSDAAVAGSETLSSGAKIPNGTRSIFVSLKGTNKTDSSNTVSFTGTSLVIRDSGAPSCSAEYNHDWTNQDVTVTINAADSDAGLEGIYVNDARVAETSPYTFIVSANDTSFTAYAMDLAGKKSDVVSGTIDHIDKTTPAAPASVPLSSSTWSRTDVSVLMPALASASGAPERYVYQIGAAAWADLPDGFAISADGNTTIRVAVADAAGNRSSSAEATAKIDKSAPTISDATITSGSSTAKVDVTASDVGLSGIQTFRYEAGEQTAEFFTTGGSAISGGTFTVNVGGTYTLFALDYAGNTTLKTISITTAPSFDPISDITIDEDETREVSLGISDAESSRSELDVQVTTSDDALLSSVVLNQSDSAISLTITPAANQSGGPVTVTVSVEDPSGQKVTRTFDVTVRAVNDNPAAQNDSGITLLEDGMVEIDVLANDSDMADGDTLSINSVGEAEHGATLIVLGKIRYTPDENYVGTDSFTYEITDGNGGTSSATVFVTVEQVNDAPEAVDDTAFTAEDTAVSIDALGNDSDVDKLNGNPDETIFLVSSTSGAHGTTQIVDGMIEYTPEANFNGTDVFTYMMEDAAGLTAEASVTVTVSPEADAPWFAGLSAEYTIDEDVKNHEIAFEIRDVETPADSLMLQAASLDSEKIDQNGIVLTGLGDNDVAVKLLISPVANQFGDVSLKLTLGDGFETVERTIVIHINNVNDAPRTGNDTVTYTEDAEFVDISIATLLQNDSDIDGDTVFFDEIASDPSHGTIELYNETTLRYVPAKDYDGTTSFTYTISDGKATTLATCTLEATGVNDTPGIIVTETELAGTEDTQIVIPFVITDNESDPADLSVIAASSDDSIVTTDGITIVNNGDGTGEVQIMPAADANGTVNITLTVSDGEAQSSDSVKLVIAPAQDAPVAEDDTIYVRFTTSRNFSVLVNDHDVDGNAISVSTYVEVLPGTLTFDEDTQTFTYVPAIGEIAISTFTYTITDGEDFDTATVTLDVESETHAPVITAIDSRYVSEDGTASDILFSVSDEDISDTATITVTSGNATLLPQDAEHISVNSLGSGNYSLTLKPGADQAGTVSVTVTATDSTSLTDSTTFYLHVIGQNDAPVAVDDALTVNEDGGLVLALLANDTDADGDTIWLSSLSSPLHGYIERTGNTYTYYPYDDWSGTETLTYRVSDGRASAQASAVITVNPVNDTPVAWEDWRELDNTGNESANINVLGNDYDVDTGDVVRTYEIVTAPKYGTAVIQPDGSITYTRTQVSPEGNGADTFVYRIIDRETATGDYLSDTATVYIGVDFISTLYTYGRTVTCYEDDSPFTFDLSVSNPTPVNYGLTVNTTTTLGTFEVIDNDTVRFTPAANQYGYASITYTVEQIGGGEKDTGTIWLRVYPVNDLPQITSAPASVTMDEDTSAGASFDVLYNDVDCANEYLYFYVYTKTASTSAPIPFFVSYSSTTIDGGRRVTVKTAENVNGTGVIIVGVSDGMTYVEKEIDLTVTPVDDAPKVNPVSKTINEDSSIVFASPGSDCEVDGDDILESIDPTRAPQHGTATMRANRTISYVPNANYFGTEVFYVLVTDQTSAALVTAQKVTIVVNPINDAPEIRDLTYYQTTLEDEAKDVPLTVSDVDNILTASSHYTLTSENQSLVKNENITISHGTGEGMIIHVVPEANAYGTVKINIVASDGSLSAKAAFSLKIVPVNDAPEANNDSASVDEVVSTGAEAKPPKTIATMNLLTNDVDVEDGKPSIVSITNVVNATVTNIGGGKVLVSADGDFSGTVTFTYTVMDRAGATDSANATLTINPINDPPRAKNDSITIFEDATPLIDALNNDTDPEGDTLSILSVGTASHGTASISDTKISYAPVKDYFGTDSFTYTVSDGNGGTATATVNITIKPINDAPSVDKHSTSAGDWTMLEDTPESFNFVVADAESAVSNLIIKITSLDETLVKTTQIALTTNAAGYKTIRVTPVANAHGTVYVKFWVSDGLLASQAIYPIVIGSVNDAPVVTAPVQTTKEDTKLTASAYATDADGDSVTFAKHTDPAHGTVTVYADGSYDYMPAQDYNGEDSFMVLANDGQPSNNIGYATVYITVKPDGDPPVAQDDTATIDEDTPSVIAVLENDSDEDAIYGDKITLLSVTTPAHGTAVIDEDGILYTPSLNYNGTDAFSYTISDRDGKLDTATVNLTVRPVNDTPTGGDDTATVLEDHSVTIEATLNDDVDETTNPDLEDVTILSVDTPAHGTATISTDKKTITYTPNANWFSPEGAPEVFYYTAKDSSDKTERFAIRVTVTSVNDLPVITPDDLPDVTTAEDTATSAITFTVSDVETAAASLTVTATHLNGVLLPVISVTRGTDGSCSFTVLPNANKVGETTVTVRVTDADGGQDSDTFTLTVTKVNDLPQAGNDAFTVAENATYTKDVLANDDVDTLSNNGGDTLTLLSIATPQYGTATIVDNKLYYVPNADRDTTANYTDVFTYTMKDASGNQCTPTVTVTVTPVNDAPTISAISNVTGIEEDAPDGTGDISFSVSDEEDDDNTLFVSTASDNTTLFPVSGITIDNPTDDATGMLRTVKVVPAADQYGTGTITLTVRDAQGLTATSSFTVTVSSVNDEPDNGDKSFTVVEDVEKQLDVLADIDPDYATTPGDYTITAIAQNPSHGTVRIASDGKSVYYKTAQDSNAPDSFQYTVFDSYGSTSYTFTVLITVTPVNDAPVIHYLGDAEYTIFEGSQQNDIPFTVTDVDNVTFAGGTDEVEVTLSAKSSNSILLVNGIHIDTLTGNDRNIDLKPYLKWNGTSTITITATDPDGLKGTASFKLIVNNINDVPVAVNDSGTIPEDVTSTIDVLDNDTDADLLTNPDSEYILVKTVTDNDPNATITRASDGLSVTVVPNANYNGPVSFTYTVVDSHNAESTAATVSLTVSQVNDAPAPQNDSATTNEDTAIDISVLTNDSDIDMDELLNADPDAESISVVITGTELTAPSHGTITTDGTKITYTPSANYNGTDTFDYYCADGDTQTKATVNVTIKQVNDYPAYNADYATIDEDTTTGFIDVMANDTDIDLDPLLNQDDLLLRSGFSISTEWVGNSAYGTVTRENNQIKFTPTANWYGVAMVFYRLQDGYGASCIGVLTVTVNSVNDLPVFDTAPENMNLTEDEANGTTTLVVSDVETAATSLAVTVTNSTNPTLIATSDVTVTKGTDGTRTITVNPKDNQNGTATITLMVDDLTLGTRTITFDVTVAAVNDAPVAADKTLDINEDASLQTITKGSLVSDVDIATNADELTLTITTAAQHGTAGIDANGNVTYVPNANFNGTDTFVYTAKDKDGLSDTGTFTVNIAQVNDAPAPQNDSATTNEDTAIDINVLSNDSDIDMDELLNADPDAESIGVVITGAGLTAPTHGTITTDGTKITYTPSANYNGTDTFDYYCSDGDTQTKATVNVTIKQVNDYPAYNADYATIDEDTTTGFIDVMANDTDIDLDPLLNQDDLLLRSGFSISTEWVGNSAYGTVTRENNQIKFTPAANWYGVAMVFYRLQDGYGASCIGVLTVTVNSVNDLPVFDTAPENMSLTEDEADGTTTLVVSDVETAATSLAVTVTNSTNPSLVATSDVTVTKGTDGTRTITVNPKDNQNGTATITLQVDDLTLGTQTITFDVTVAAVNDTPVANDKTLDINEDASLQTITKGSLTSDVDIATNSDALTLTITTAAQHGTAGIDANGNVTYVPGKDFNGTDTFVYTVKDKANAPETGTFTVNIAQVNDAPVTQNDSATTNEDTAIDINVLTNDSDIDMDELLNADPDTESIGVVITGTELTAPSHGTISTDGTKITYTPDENYNGTDTFDYYCADGDTQTKATVNVTIKQVNDIPVANPENVTIQEDSATDYIDVMANDTDVDLDPALNENDLLLRSKFYISAASVNISSYGTVDLTENMIKFTPTANWSGVALVYYTLQDGYGMSCSTALRVTVNPVNDLPVFNTAPEDMNLSEDGVDGSVDIVVSDVETAAASLAVTVTDSSNPTLIATSDVTVTKGTDGTRTITVNPKDNQNGTATITLQVDDLTEGTRTITFVVNVAAVNDVPVADDKTLDINEDASLQTIAKTLLTRDVDIATNADELTLTITAAASHGTAAIDANGNVTYVPNANFNGVDTFVYTVKDKANAPDTGTFTINIAQVNDAPVTQNDSATTDEDKAIDISVLTNDSDVDMDELLNADPDAESIGVVITGTELTAPSHGTISTDSKKITYTPSANYNGTDTFDYYCSDGDTQTKATVNVTIHQVNDNPVANTNIVSTDEDTVSVAVDVLANDSDIDIGSVLNAEVSHARSTFTVTAATLTNSDHGSVNIVDNKLVFTPAPNWFGVEVVNYTMSDGHGGTASSTLTVTVNSVNDLPVFDTEPEDMNLSEDGLDGSVDIVVSDVETAAKDLAVTVTNSTNPSLVATSDVTVTKGTDGTRTITVNPKDNQNGTATITLKVDDLTEGTRTITFVVNVAAVNDAPVADDKTLDIDEDASLQTITKGSLTSDVDIATNADALTLTITTAAQHGSAGIDANGNVTYVPNANFNGTDTFVYTVKDKALAPESGTFTINIAQVNDAPVTQNDSATTNEDKAIDIGVLTNDSDVDMDEALNADPDAESIGVVIDDTGLTEPSHGTITTDGTKITYTPDENYNGTDTFDYYCFDGVEKVKATVNVTILQVNDNPSANADSTSTNEDTKVSYDVLDNDADVDTIGSLNENDLHLKSEFVIDSCYFYGGAHGTLKIEGASIEYTPASDFYGTQVIKYVLNDGNGGTSTGTLTILVGSKNDAPIAENDEMSAMEDHTASVNVLTNDTDVDTGDTKTFVGFLEPTSGLGGTFTTDANGDISFEPDENYNGSFDILYQMRDAAGLTSSATLTVTITPVNDAPVANDGVASTNEDTLKNIDVSSLIGDVDIDTNDDTIQVSVTEAGEPAHGTISVTGTVITYTPDANYNGADEITYTVTDSKGLSDTGKIAITVNAVNDAPKAANDAKTTAEDTAATILALGNDADIDTDVTLNLSPAAAPYILSVENGAHGKATTDGTKIVYTPDENYNGTDTIDYVLSDGLLTDEASVSITITQVNDGIHAVDDTAKTNDEDKVTIDALSNDWDVDTDADLNEDDLHLRSSFRITAVGTPEHGTAEIVSGKIDYTPDDRFAGTDSFTYTASDGNGTTASGKVTVTVVSVNDPPVIISVTSPKEGDRAGTGSKVTVTWTGFDIDGDALTYLLEYYDGKTWHQVADKLVDTTYVFAIPDTLASTDGLKFRVNVRDSEFTSDYGYSGAMKVDKDAPTGTIVTMQTADGRTYTAGTWTNQTVTVVASSAVDASKVTYYYDMDGGISAAAANMEVTQGVHTVNIKAVDEYGNTAVVGAYLARVDKQQPSVPDIRESSSGGSVTMTLTLQTDPGGSGNDKLTLPDGTTVKATGNPTFAVTKNGTYSFTLTDVAGNRRAFTYTVSTVDVSKPAITLGSGAYRIGTKTQEAISATLTFSDAESEIVNRGYQITTGSTASGAYRTYEGALKLSDPGTYYIHAYAKNAFGLTTTQTFGPFIIEAVAAPAATPTPKPEIGDVVVTKEDIEEIPGDTVKIRLPGKEWSETLTLEGVGPGTYLVEAMDEDGNIRTVEVKVTMRDIFARSMRSAGDNVTIAAVAAIALLAGLMLFLLLAGHNVTIVVVGSRGAAAQKLRTLRRIKSRKKELIIKLDEKNLSGGEFCDIKIAKTLSKRMRGNTVIVTMRGAEVLRELIPQDFDEAFRRKILIER